MNEEQANELITVLKQMRNELTEIRKGQTKFKQNLAIFEAFNKYAERKNKTGKAVKILGE